MLFSILFSNFFFFFFLCFQMVRHQKENCPGRTRFLHTVSSVHPLHWDHLQPLLHSRPGLKPSPVGTLAQQWQLPCFNWFLSRTPKLQPFNNKRTLLLLWMRRFRDSLITPGLQTRHLNLLLKHQQGLWRLFPQLLGSSLKTRTSGFPTEPPTHLQSLSEAALCVWGWQQLQRKEQRKHRRDTHWFTGSWTDKIMLDQKENECLSEWDHDHRLQCLLNKLSCWRKSLDLGLVYQFSKPLLLAMLLLSPLNPCTFLSDKLMNQVYK